MQERRFDPISAVYHLLDDTSVAKSNSSSNITNDFTHTATPAAGWPSLSDSQHLEKVRFSVLRVFVGFPFYNILFLYSL